MKKKVMCFMPGDNVNVKVHLTCKTFTVLKIEAIEIDEPYNDEVNVDLDV